MGSRARPPHPCLTDERRRMPFADGNALPQAWGVYRGHMPTSKQNSTSMYAIGRLDLAKVPRNGSEPSSAMTTSLIVELNLPGILVNTLSCSSPSYLWFLLSL